MIAPNAVKGMLQRKRFVTHVCSNSAGVAFGNLHLIQYVQRLRDETRRLAQRSEGQTRLEHMSDRLDAVLTATGDAAHTVLEDFEAISSMAEVLLVLAYHRRRVVYFNVTEHPAAKWTAQQIVEAFP